MAFRVEKRGKLTYYRQGDRPVVCALVTEAQTEGDLTIYFAKLTGGYSARSAPGWDKPVSIKLRREIPLVSCGGSGACEMSASPIRPVEAELAEMHVFGRQKAPPFRSTRPVARPSNTAGTPSTCPVTGCHANPRCTWWMSSIRLPLASSTGSPSCNGPEMARADTLEYTNV